MDEMTNEKEDLIWKRAMYFKKAIADMRKELESKETTAERKKEILISLKETTELLRGI